MNRPRVVDWKAVARMYRRREKLQKIADHFRISTGMVSRIAKAEGVPMRQHPIPIRRKTQYE